MDDLNLTRIAADFCGMDAFRMIKTSEICPNPYRGILNIDQMKLNSLVDRLRADGVTSPLHVRRIGDENIPHFELISDETVYRACLIAEIPQVPCLVINAEREFPSMLEEMSFPKNYFEALEHLNLLLSQKMLDEGELLRYFSISSEEWERYASLLQFDQTERKLILGAKLRPEIALLLLELEPRAKCEIYRALISGISERSAEELIKNYSETRVRTKICVKNLGFFYNTIEKAIITMNRSGISVKCAREERKTLTRFTITIPKRS